MFENIPNYINSPGDAIGVFLINNILMLKIVKL